MYVHCAGCRLRQQPMFRQFSGPELAFVACLKSDQIELGPHEHIVRSGENGHRLYTLLSGWAFRYKTLASGKRQILDFLLPGSLVGLQSPLIGQVDHSVCTITAATFCALDGAPFTSVFRHQPELAAALMEMLVREQERADMRLLLLGRQRPTERLAYLLLELRWRLDQQGVMDEERCELPLTYEMMADAAGMSRSQLAHSLSELRELGWASVEQGLLCFYDVAKMSNACGYTPPRTDIPQAIL